MGTVGERPRPLVVTVAPGQLNHRVYMNVIPVLVDLLSFEKNERTEQGKIVHQYLVTALALMKVHE